MSKYLQIETAALDWIDNGGTSEAFAESQTSILRVIRKIEASEDGDVPDLESAIEQAEAFHE